MTTRELGRTVADDGVSVAWSRWTPDAVTDPVPVVLQHGFVSSTVGNRVNTGVVEAFLTTGRVVLGIDAIPHGRLQLVAGDHLSALKDPAFTRALVDHLAPSAT